MVRPKKKQTTEIATQTTLRNRKHKRFIPRGFPASTTAILTYCDCVSMNPGVTPSTYAFRANGLYDPNQTSIGHQPMFFDTYASIYDHYVVTKADCKVTFYPQSETAGTSAFAVVAGIKLDDDSTITPATALTTLIEQPDKTFHYKVIRSGALYDKNITKVKHHYDPVKFFGIKDIKDNQDTLGAATTTNPVEEAYFLVTLGSPGGDIDMPNIEFMVTIDYTVQFSEIKDQAAS